MPDVWAMRQGDRTATSRPGDQNGIQAAINYAGSGSGGTVFFPPGSYLATALTYPTLSSVSLIGSGAQSTIIQRSGTAPLITLAHSYQRSEWYSRIEGLTLDGNNTDGILLDVETTTQFVARDVYIRRSTGTGLKILSVRDSHFEDVFVEDCGSSTAPCIVLDSTAVADQAVDQCRFFDLHTETNADAIHLDLIGNATNTVKTNRFYGLKLHGANDASGTNNPNRPLLRLSANANTNEFYGLLVAFGRGTSQVEVNGGQNLFVGPEFGLGTVAQAATAFDLFGGKNQIIAPNFVTAAYTTTYFRNNANANYNVVHEPQYLTGGPVLFTDAGFLTVIYNNLSGNGKHMYDNRGWVFDANVTIDTSADLVLGNATDILMKDSGGTNRNILTTSGSDLIKLHPLAAGQVWRFINFADTVVLLEIADSGNLTIAGNVDLASAKVYKVNGTQVVSAQGAAVADASGGATVDTEARAALNALLARLRTHGLIAT